MENTQTQSLLYDAMSLAAWRLR